MRITGRWQVFRTGRKGSRNIAGSSSAHHVRCGLLWALPGVGLLRPCNCLRLNGPLEGCQGCLHMGDVYRA